MPEKGLADLFLDAGHVGEVSRLLAIAQRHRHQPLRRRELIELVRRTAGAGHRYPRPVPALEVSLRLGLLARTGLAAFRLTSLGDRFVQQGSLKTMDLSPVQGQLLLGLMLDDEEMLARTQEVVSLLREREDGRLGVRTGSLMTVRVRETARLLQQLLVLAYVDGHLTVNREFEAILPEAIRSVAPMSEEALWRRLEEQRERALFVEKLVLEEERLRLRESGRADLADGVFRISESNVAAGYDIESFERDGSKRLIEVKSSTGRYIQFEWSVNERRVAEAFRRAYWVYFVPLAHSLPAQFCPTVMIRDPIGGIRRGSFTEVAVAFRVSERSRIPVDRRIVFSPACRMAEWQISSR